MAERLHRSDLAQLAAEKKERVRKMVGEGFHALVEELQQGKPERFLCYLDFGARFHHRSQETRPSSLLNHKSIA